MEQQTKCRHDSLWGFMAADAMKRQQALVYLINSAISLQIRTFVNWSIDSAITLSVTSEYQLASLRIIK